MTTQQAKQTLKTYFEFFTELYSIMHEVTDNGYLTKADIDKLSDTELIAVAEDAAYQIKVEAYS